MMYKDAFDVSSEKDQQIIRWHIEHKCAEEGCRNYAENGLRFCVLHVYGLDWEMHEEPCSGFLRRKRCLRCSDVSRNAVSKQINLS